MEEYTEENYKEDRKIINYYLRKYHSDNKFVQDNLEEIRQTCLLCLARARKKYDKEKSSYCLFAMKCIEHEIFLYYRLHKNDNIASISIDQVLPGTEDLTLSDCIASNEDVEQNAINNETMQKFWHLVCTKKKLNKPKTKQVVYLYFFKGYKYVEIARLIGVNRERVRKIIQYTAKIVEPYFAQK